VLHIKILILII